MNARNEALLKDLAATAPKTAIAVDRPMVAAKDLLDYRTQQVESLVETSAQLERDRARLAEALRSYVAAINDNPFAKNYVSETTRRGARALLRELGEAP